MRKSRVMPDFFYALTFFPVGNETGLPLFMRDSWYATSMGAATAIEE
jgi:hypothetical protein